LIWLRDAIHASFHKFVIDECGCFEDEIFEFESAAAAAFRALAEAGRLLPVGGETAEQWNARHPDSGHLVTHSTDRDSLDRYDLGRELALEWVGTNDMQAVRRAVRSWPDGSQWTGPWKVVE
jgi:hypothetical protein